MFHPPAPSLHDYVIRCKGCQRNILAPVQTIPDACIIAECPLCSEKRRYLPAEIFRGRLSSQLMRKAARSTGRA